MPFTYAYARPSVTTDCLIFRPGKDDWELLLIRRGHPPFQGMWALPGGFLEMTETLEETAARELQEETNLTGIELKQFRAYSALGRDPRQRTIGVVFYGFAETGCKARPGDDAAETGWFPVHHLPELAFDHAQITTEGISELLPV